MEYLERLTIEAADADTVLACEHRQRYEFAAPLCAGRRVLDLCCGSGYGSAILAAHAAQVVGVDNDSETIETGWATLQGRLPNLAFECADAVAYLRGQILERFDLIVCFEGLEHLQELDRALALLREHAAAGMRIIASVPNSRLFEEQNPFHATDFGYDEALKAFAGFRSVVMLPQYLAEGSLICPAGAQSAEVGVRLGDRDEIEYANHFIFCVNLADEITDAHRGELQVTASPVYNRWAEGLKRGLRALEDENARLARSWMGKRGSAAASALASLLDREAALEAREAGYGDGGGIGLPDVSRAIPAGVTSSGVPRPPLGTDPNSWEERHRKASEVVIPWIERTVPLAGTTVLEYGCGDSPVTCALAPSAARVIGVDIDRESIARARKEVADRGLSNVELELHEADSILDAVATRRGEIDVFLCYAVLEHLSVEERLAVLRLAREVVKPDGALVVCEAPNRLVYFDHHTAQMPFFHLLPDDLALEYFHHSTRTDFEAAIESAAGRGRDAALETLARWGRGVSFHEFEVVFGDLSRHVIASNYDPLLFPERPVQPDEVILARYLERWRPDLAPVWSRYWLDLILSPRPVTEPPRFLRPWMAETVSSDGVGWTKDEQLFLAGPGAALRVALPSPTTRLVLGVISAEPVTLYVERGEAAPLAGDADDAAVYPCYITYPLDEPVQDITVRASDECWLTFVGYER
jgi:2-polyprenyl-3-methyl-5-hydroxy-6-metoxy-1,4-benzoquinol methylase